MEIDEKHLKQHFEIIMNTKELSDLTLKQARIIATLMEHERLKAITRFTAECIDFPEFKNT